MPFGSLFGGLGIAPSPLPTAPTLAQQIQVAAAQQQYQQALQQQLQQYTNIAQNTIYTGPRPNTFNPAPYAIEEVYRNWLSTDERAMLSPAAVLAIESGSTDEIYLNEIRCIIGKRFL